MPDSQQPDLFQQIRRERRPAKILVTGPAGSGKTRTAMDLVAAFADKVAVAQTEPSAELYVDQVPNVQFRSFVMDRLVSARWIEVMQNAAESNYGAMILDSISDEWSATLAVVDAQMTKDGRQDSRAGWRVARPDHNAMLTAITRLPIHVIATCRSKMVYDWSSQDKRMLGYEPIQDNDIAYFFDAVIEMSEQTGTIVKCRGFDATGMSAYKPNAEWIRPYADWLAEGQQPTVGSFAMLRLRHDFPQLSETQIREAVRAAGVTKDSFHNYGWYAEVEQACQELASGAKSG